MSAQKIPHAMRLGLRWSRGLAAGAWAPLRRGALPQPLQRQTATSAAAADAARAAEREDSISDEEWGKVVSMLGSTAATKNNPNAAGGWRDAYEYMPVHMQRVGLTHERLAALNVIHVAGTKGKGSTCAMVESVMRCCGYRTALYTSPHLVDVRERIRLDGKMLPRGEFAAAFWRVYGALRSAADADAERLQQQHGQQPSGAAAGAAVTSAPGRSDVAVGMPSFFSFMTLLAMHIFTTLPAHRAPHVVVLEVGIGGRLDATNALVPRPAAACVTSLGFDHMDLLGHTLPEIAREKAGIMKPGRPVLAAPQPDDAMGALQEAASRVGAPLQVPPPLDAYQTSTTSSSGSTATSRSPTTAAATAAAALVGLGGAHMRLNASLAVALAATWEQQYAAAAAARRVAPWGERAPAAAAAGGGGGAAGVDAGASAQAQELVLVMPPGAPAAEGAAARSAAVLGRRELPAEYCRGLQHVSWPGRSQVVHDAHAPPGRLTFYLDGAHTPESMATCAAWFAEQLQRAHGEAAEAAAAAGSRAPGLGLEAAGEGGGGGGGGGSGGAPPRGVTVLLFGCMRDRDPAVLLPALAEALAGGGGGGSGAYGGAGGGAQLHAAVFAPMLSGGGVMLPPAAVGKGTGSSSAAAASSSGTSSTSIAGVGVAAQGEVQQQQQQKRPVVDLSWQERMGEVWRQRCGGAMATRGTSSASQAVQHPPPDGAAGATTLLPPVWVAPSLPEALQVLRAHAANQAPGVHVRVLVTGSLYLVGDMLRLLGQAPP